MNATNPLHRSATLRQRGFAASVIVIALVAVLATLLLGTSRVVASLQRELRQVENRQQAKYPAPSPTNTVAQPAPE